MTQEIDWTPPVRGSYASSFRYGEWITGPVTPLFDDWALPRLEAAMHAMHRHWTGQPAPLPHHVTINGWYFYSTAWVPVSARALLRWAPSLMAHLLRHPRRVAPVLPPTAKYGLYLYERDWHDEVLPRLSEAFKVAEARVEDEQVAAMPALVDELLDLAGEYFAWVTVIGGAAYKAEIQLASFYRKHLAPTIGGSHLTLLIGLGGPTEPPPHAVETLDWASPTLGERGVATAAGTAQAGPALRARREAAEQAARSALAGSPRRSRQFEERLAEAQRLGPVREIQMSGFTQPWPALRRALARIGAAVAERGVIRAADDVYYLRHRELTEALAGAMADDLGAIVEARRLAVREAADLIPPAFAGDVPKALGRILEMTASQMGAGGDAGTDLLGIPVSPGSATGPARVVRGADGFGDLQPGDVLVAPLTAPAWTPLFARAAAVVTDGGNAFSHASVVAREYGIPAVVGCRDATRRLSSGQVVTVDGSAGTVTVP